MASVCFYFQAHQPMRVRRYSIFDVGKSHEYFEEKNLPALDNKKILEKVATKSYLPANKVILDLLKKHPEFKVSFSISGILLEQLERDFPEVLESFIKLVKTGRVELLSETYYHSLAFLHSRREFESQVRLHRRKIEKIFKLTPRVFRNTELIYNNELAKTVTDLGYRGMLLEGAEHILDRRSPNFIYCAKSTPKLKLLLRNYKLSDDIAFRFSTHAWEEFPLNAPKFASWVHQINGSGEVVNLFMDYETFGEHQWEETGIFEFLKHLPREILHHPDNEFVTPSEAIKKYEARGELDVENFVSWADIERDLSAWLSNPMQADAMQKLYNLEVKVLASKDKKIIEDWRRLQTSDHFYYMCTKWFADGDVHKYFNPYETPYEAFINFVNVLEDLKLRLKSSRKNSKSQTLNSKETQNNKFKIQKNF